MTLRVRKLRLDGLNRSYGVSFLDDSGSIRPVSIISGEILTGKTSVLEFIGYCLGGKQFPQHLEIAQNVNLALLEVDIDGSTYVIERSCIGRASKHATIHSSDLDGLKSPHRSVEADLDPPSDDGSLSSFFLRHLGLGDIELREAPTKESSGVDRLSIRDLLRLMYVPYRTLGGDNLLLERAVPVVRLKHEQVIDLLFGAHDNQAATVAAALRSLAVEIKKQQSELDAVLAFMQEQEVPSRESLASRLDALNAELESSQELLNGLEQEMEAVADFGTSQRAAYQEAAQEAAALANEMRSSQTQIERLTALAAQYDQDVKKLTFAKEASALFDPFLITICPWCMLPMESDHDDSEACRVCKQDLVAVEEQGGDFDLERELRAVVRRQKELHDLLDELHDSSTEAGRRYSEASFAAEEAQQSLDRTMRSRFAPYVDQRDLLVASIASATQDTGQLSRHLLMHDGVARRRQDIAELRQKEAELLLDQGKASQVSSSREDAVDALSERFVQILQDFRFPKLNDAYLDARYVPYVRGISYDQVGSAGAGTLVTLAWYLSIFELTAEASAPHPGLLMIDSPQKGLMAKPGEESDEFQSESIAVSMYQHILDWAAEHGRDNSVQLIIVDNTPQPNASDVIAVRYSGRADDPPYGLIDDAIS